ncbi:MAG TPA: response regulator [Phototrophicaceae bacterium]|nr:response regulator [Phototrophicaceae bacterium]
MTTIPRNVLNGWDVLVVDDEPDSLEVASRLLRHYGAQVRTAINGEEALNAVRERRPTIVVSDLSMPVLDGWGLIFALKQNRSTIDLPVIALTAHAMVGDRDRAISAGFHNYLIKPLTPSTFIKDLLRLLVEIPEFAEPLKEYANV